MRNYKLPTTNYSLRESRWLAVSLLIVSALTHFIGLGYPREVVFDEVHFGKFVSAYCCTGERFFDIHPPHAKLLIAGAVKLSGYDGNLSFEHIGQPYGEFSPVPWRIVPALAGTLLPLVIFGVLRQLGTSASAAWFGGMVVVLDNALTVQTRVIALDGVLLVATFGSLWAYLAAEKLLQRRGLTGRVALGLLVAGSLAGLAVGTKFTGLIALGLLGVLVLYRLVASRSLPMLRRWIAAGALVVLSAAAIYAAGWVVHVVLLPNPGSGDAWGVEKWDLLKLHTTMYNANNGLTTIHHDSSPWRGWPFMNTPVFYWHKSAPAMAPLVAAMYFIGNPLVWIGSTLLLFVVVVWTGFTAVQQRKKIRTLASPAVLVPLVGYALAFYPLTRVDRGLFLYHYLTPLLFALLLSVVWLDQRGWFAAGSLHRQPSRVYLSLVILLFFFILFSPLTFGLFIDPDIQKILFWSDSWR